MKLPEYITIDEVKRVCSELGISDWTRHAGTDVSVKEAEAIFNEIDTTGMDILLEDFIQGLEVELEHGTLFMETNVTNNHPVLTGMIVVAHMKETLDYYKRLDVAEFEGDLFNAIRAGNLEKIEKYYKKLSAARMALNQEESGKLG